MKKFNLSLVAILAMGTFAVAGGDIAPVEEPMVEVVAPVADDSGFYIGGAYSSVNAEQEFLVNDGSSYFEEVDLDIDAFMLQVGYKINKYIAIEGRYWKGIADADYKWQDGFYDDGDKIIMAADTGEEDEDFNAWGIYVKPMFPVTEQIDIYGLLGYANVSFDPSIPDHNEFSENGFSWGAGVSFDVTDNLSVFADYVLLYDDSETWEDEDKLDLDTKVDTWNFGLTYRF